MVKSQNKNSPLKKPASWVRKNEITFIGELAGLGQDRQVIDNRLDDVNVGYLIPIDASDHQRHLHDLVVKQIRRSSRESIAPPPRIRHMREKRERFPKYHQRHLGTHIIEQLLEIGEQCGVLGNQSGITTDKLIFNE